MDKELDAIWQCNAYRSVGYRVDEIECTSMRSPLAWNNESLSSCEIVPRLECALYHNQTSVKTRTASCTPLFATFELRLLCMYIVRHSFKTHYSNDDDLFRCFEEWLDGFSTCCIIKEYVSISQTSSDMCKHSSKAGFSGRAHGHAWAYRGEGSMIDVHGQ